MFTGLVATTGTIGARAARGPGLRLSIQAAFDDGPLELGESIAVDGACLSVDAIVGDGFEVDASGETVARTTLGRLPPGSPVHLERSLRAADRLGGHIVTGHVDGLGTLVERRPIGESIWMEFQAPEELSRFLAEKGSVTVDGVSLTVNAVREARFEVVIIPHTSSRTKLGTLSPGQLVNLEVDLVARYLARLISFER
jgi:riboflavin synthase